MPKYVKPSGKFSIKTTMYPVGRARSVDGPWKATWEEAVTAFKAMLDKKGLAKFAVYSPFIAAECEEKDAGSGDGRHYYNPMPNMDPKLYAALAAAGVKLPG